jgi:DnaK suppressor protein
MNSPISHEQLTMLRNKLKERSASLHRALEVRESTLAPIESESQDYELTYVGVLDQEVGSEIDDHRHVELSDIDAAMRRMDDGSYGNCQSCGADIGIDRLVAYPVARRCIDCKQAFERQSASV